QTVAGDRATIPVFKEKDRLSFLEICGIRQLSHCVISKSETELWKPCPSMQSLVRSVIPYIQRFLYYHDELAEVYSELTNSNIAEKLKRLSFGQVGKLYMLYELDVADSEDPVIELQDVICLLKDEKELCIQKDHINDKLEILRFVFFPTFTSAVRLIPIPNYIKRLYSISFGFCHKPSSQCCC
ncbi:hypothetical protein GOODEAATRI_005249, partial [Goodea atripinnis]